MLHLIENSTIGLANFDSSTLGFGGNLIVNQSGGNRAIIIEGLWGGYSPDIATSANERHYLMETVFGFEVTHLGPNEEKLPTENNIDKAMDKLAKRLKPCENFSIYITGHGRENDGAVEMVGGFMLTPEKFSKWICRIENGVHIAVTVASCYSGKWIDALKKWDNKVEIIYASTDNDSIGWGDLDQNTEFTEYRESVSNGAATADSNPSDVGLEAISGLVEDMEALKDNFKRGEISWVKLWQEAIKSAKTPHIRTRISSRDGPRTTALIFILPAVERASKIPKSGNRPKLELQM